MKYDPTRVYISKTETEEQREKAINLLMLGTLEIVGNSTGFNINAPNSLITRSSEEV